MWKRDTLILKENYSLRCTGVRSSTLNCLVTASPSTLTTRIYKPLESIHLRHLTPSPPRLQRMLLRLQKRGLVIRYQPDKNIEIAVHSSGYHQKKRSHSWDEGPTWTTSTCTLNSVTAFYRELENKQVCRAQRVTIQDQTIRPK